MICSYDAREVCKLIYRLYISSVPLAFAMCFASVYSLFGPLENENTESLAMPKRDVFRIMNTYF